MYESQIGDKFVLDLLVENRQPGPGYCGSDAGSGGGIQAAVLEGGRREAGRFAPVWRSESCSGSWEKAAEAGGRFKQAIVKHLKMVKPVSGSDALTGTLTRLGLDGAAACNAASFLRRQIVVTGGLPDDRTIVGGTVQRSYGKQSGHGARTVWETGQCTAVSSFAAYGQTVMRN